MVPGPSNDEERTNQAIHQTVQGERASLFHRNVMQLQPLYSNMSMQSRMQSLPSSFFTLARIYHQNWTNSSRTTSSRSAERARSRTVRPSHVSQPYLCRACSSAGGSATNYRRPRPDLPRKAANKTPKDFFLLDVGATTMPKGAKKAPLYENKQVKSSLKIDPNWKLEFVDKIEEEFASILDTGKPPPR